MCESIFTKVNRKFAENLLAKTSAFGFLGDIIG